jgi:hypothetical protein
LNFVDNSGFCLVNGILFTFSMCLAVHSRLAF